MISQPMDGLTEEQILKSRNEAIDNFVDEENYEVADTYYDSEHDKERVEIAKGKKHPDLAYLALSLLDMADCDTVIFCKGWSKARGCQIEHDAAEKYGLEIVNTEG